MKPRVVYSGSALFIGMIVAGAAAQVPTYSTFQLQVRSNLCANEPTGYNLPCNVDFNSSTPAINDAGQVSIKITTSPQGAWFGSNGVGSIVCSAPSGAIISDVSINNSGYVVYPQTLSSQNGIYFYNHTGGNCGFLTNQPIGSNAWGGAMVNDLGQVGYRAGFSGPQAYYSFQPPSSLILHAADNSAVPGSPYSFLFTPRFNNSRQIAALVRLGNPGQTGNSQPDQIRIFNADGTSILIAEDKDSNPASPYNSFDNGIGFSHGGWVAYTATLPGSVRGVFVSNGTITRTIARTDQPEVNSIDFFAPAVNDNGLVAFRGRDGSNLFAIFVGDGKTLRRVIGQFDPIPTDIGMGQIAQHDNSNVFGGSVNINSHGDIVFHCALTPQGNNQVEWGSGVYIAKATPACVPADINCDGVVNVNDLLAVINGWGACPAKGPCPADIAPPGGDGVVNVNDLLMVINNWG
jgi:hypothetical protein